MTRLQYLYGLYGVATTSLCDAARYLVSREHGSGVAVELLLRTCYLAPVLCIQTTALVQPGSYIYEILLPSSNRFACSKDIFPRRVTQLLFPEHMV